MVRPRLIHVFVGHDFRDETFYELETVYFMKKSLFPFPNQLSEHPTRVVNCTYYLSSIHLISWIIERAYV